MVSRYACPRFGFENISAVLPSLFAAMCGASPGNSIWRLWFTVHGSQLVCLVVFVAFKLCFVSVLWVCRRLFCYVLPKFDVWSYWRGCVFIAVLLRCVVVLWCCMAWCGCRSILWCCWSVFRAVGSSAVWLAGRFVACFLCVFCLFVCLFACLLACLPACPPACLPAYAFSALSAFAFVCICLYSHMFVVNVRVNQLYSCQPAGCSDRVSSTPTILPSGRTQLKGKYAGIGSPIFACT